MLRLVLLAVRPPGFDRFVQWVTFVTHSSAEAELFGYCDAVVMSEAVSPLVNLLADHRLQHEEHQELLGDSQTGFRIVQVPADGPWRTTHLRLPLDAGNLSRFLELSWWPAW